jgi:hypothetical protein
MTTKQFAAILAFGFVAAAFGLGLVAALLCLVGAGLAWGATGVAVGELNADELRDRMEGARSGFSQPERKHPPR